MSSPSPPLSEKNFHHKDEGSLTPKDIADLCSQLQSVVERVPSPSTPAAATAGDTNSSTKSLSLPDSSRSPSITSTPAAAADCPCRHIVEAKKGATNKHCALCGRTIPVLEELQAQQERVTTLENDLRVLNGKYVDEIDRVAELQHAKAQAEAELEELSQQLFEEANGMVASEKREKTDLQRELEDTRERLAAEESQLRQLRQLFQDELDQQGGGRRLSLDNTKITSDRLDTRRADKLVVDEFATFVKQSRSLPPRKLMTMPFVKHSVEEDALPCLRFGPHPRMSARKLVDALALNTCFIEKTPPGFEKSQQYKVIVNETPLKISVHKLNLWDRFSGDVLAVSGCQACGRHDPQTPLEFRVRVSTQDDWACIDGFCRDRLVAVCEFFGFLRNVQQGYYNSRSVPDLYREVLQLRLQMFMARMGIGHEQQQRATTTSPPPEIEQGSELLSPTQNK
ncbi:hypothetical protein O0I10_001782 [Lichtheimia ornata]|uniref:GDP/GTP exchange factor Sec2 N-terminal domain-containing protein n=1 Tax=Lichtheimia ornata TaxID=688661 RepID=A0AAD7Y2S1_9FUNG|nr:uncharacterized protein O0I10_001782 [Lichtheimia ornata]KAJ8662092.1 hypothetical protein O0I10_001782 [Lichtheimia ornata]